MPPEFCPANSGTLSDIGRNPVRIKSESVSEWRRNTQLLGVGLMWPALMLAFEVGFGVFVFRAPWRRIAADFDFRKGGLLSIGMLVLLIAPVLVGKLRGLV